MMCEVCMGKHFTLPHGEGCGHGIEVGRSFGICRFGDLSTATSSPASTATSHHIRSYGLLNNSPKGT